MSATLKLLAIVAAVVIGYALLSFIALIVEAL